MAFEAGAYTVSYGGSSIGQARDVYVEWMFRKQLIRGDTRARTPQDAVYLGMEAWIGFVGMEWDDAQLQDAFWPYDATIGTQGQVGRLDVGSSLTKALVLQDIAGTPAATNPIAFNASRAILEEEFSVEHLIAARIREIPLRMRLYPTSGVMFTLVDP